MSKYKIGDRLGYESSRNRISYIVKSVDENQQEYGHYTLLHLPENKAAGYHKNDVENNLFLIPKIKITRLAKKMYPNYVEEDGYLVEKLTEEYENIT